MVKRPPRSNEPVLASPYYRGDDRRPMKVGAVPSNVAGAGSPPDLNPLGPAQDGILWAKANAANVGPYLALHGRPTVRPFEILSQLNPAGNPNPHTMLARNDETVPKFIRVRLQPRTGAMPAEGRIGVGQMSDTPVINMEWIDLWNNSDHKLEMILENGMQLWAIGVWPGVVPVSIFVTVVEWMP
jgi:hypothetical protein